MIARIIQQPGSVGEMAIQERADSIDNRRRILTLIHLSASASEKSEEESDTGREGGGVECTSRARALKTEERSAQTAKAVFCFGRLRI